jgi:hypothetical protein
MLPRLIGIVKQNLSGAKRRRNGHGGDGGVGQGAAVPCPASAHSDPERGQRSALCCDSGRYGSPAVRELSGVSARLEVDHTKH